MRLNSWHSIWIILSTSLKKTTLCVSCLVSRDFNVKDCGPRRRRLDFQLPCGPENVAMYLRFVAPAQSSQKVSFDPAGIDRKSLVHVSLDDKSRDAIHGLRFVLCLSIWLLPSVWSVEHHEAVHTSRSRKCNTTSVWSSVVARSSSSLNRYLVFNVVMSLMYSGLYVRNSLHMNLRESHSAYGFLQVLHVQNAGNILIDIVYLIGKSATAWRSASVATSSHLTRSKSDNSFVITIVVLRVHWLKRDVSSVNTTWSQV